MTSQPHSTEVAIVDSLSHPLAVWLREVLEGTQKAARLIVIDDEENILQALRAGLKVARVFHTADQPLSDRLRRMLPPTATVYEIAKRTSKKLFETSKLSRTFAVAQAPEPLNLILVYRCQVLRATKAGEGEHLRYRNISRAM